jgi:hypothetical protein
MGAASAAPFLLDHPTLPRGSLVRWWAYFHAKFSGDEALFDCLSYAPEVPALDREEQHRQKGRRVFGQSLLPRTRCEHTSHPKKGCDEKDRQDRIEAERQKAGSTPVYFSVSDHCIGS